MSIQIVQQKLQAAGYDPGPVDGRWGPRTASALDQALAREPATTPDVQPLAWGARVSQGFRQRVRQLCSPLGIEPDHLMACMAFESGETFSAAIRNAAGSGATGLIQFMPATARALGTSTDALARLTPEEQLAWVERYFLPYRGRLATLEDTYMAILLPSMIGKPNDAVLFSGGVAYRQNAGLDANHDGKVTKAEAAAKVREKLVRGLQEGFAWTGPQA